MSGVQDVAELVEQLKSGNQDAASELYQRYAQRLCHQIERRIGQHLQGRLEAGDVLQSAFRTFFRRAANGEYQIDYTGDLWNLLLTITLNKVRGQAEHQLDENAILVSKCGLACTFTPMTSGVNPPKPKSCSRRRTGVASCET